MIMINGLLLHKNKGFEGRNRETIGKKVNFPGKYFYCRTKDQLTNVHQL